ncbi:trypco2 family protein [Actinomadura sp. NPDC000929]|uniref:trypco2 family protein n=1 Tax=Actinomadura sp. NPDC000929 TaxID=3154517 RepID=UPI0033961B86
MIELPIIISELKAQLSRAIRDSSQEDLHFELGPIELELTVTVTEEVSGGVKVRFWVLDAHGETKAATATNHRIKLTLDPRLSSSGTNPWVSGKSFDGER